MANIYESELVYKLMERDGLNIPSSVPPYESEIKAYLIEQVKLAYPKLNDYEAEWLLYNYTKHLPAEFPIETITNVTDATVNNVVPYAYKSAILKGNSEVVVGKNKCNMEKIESGWIDGTTGTPNGTSGVLITVEVSGTITISNYIHSTYRYVYEYDVDGNYLGRNPVSTDIVTLVLNKNTTLIKIGFYGGNLSTVKSLKLQVEQGEIATEYEPYNQTLVSVKMPVLTTTGKNLFDITKHNNLIINDNGEYITTKYYSEASPVKYSLKKNTTYSVSYVKNGTFSMSVNGVWVNTNSSSAKFTTDDSGEYIIKIGADSYNNINKKIWDNIQIKEGSVATYEPYKSNILTTNEEVTLRGVGEVKDELNLITGELTQRIGEVVLDGSENWKRDSDTSNQKTISAYVTQLIDTNQTDSTNIICERFQSKKINEKDEEGIYIHRTKGFRMRISIDKLSSPDIDGFKRYLQSNPVTVQYPTTESIKTVDLSVVDENGNEINHFMPIEGTMHIQSDGEPIKPSVTMEIPVEATTQNLASFIEMEV